MAYWGETAALTTAILWSFTSIFFTSAGRRIGSYHLNKIRIPTAAILLGVTLLITEGRLFPAQLSSSATAYLVLSGIIGLTLGDLCLFTAFVIIGTRLTLLIFATSPIIAALIAWPLLGEALGFWAVAGILITISGVVWVVREKGNGAHSFASGKKLLYGILLAMGGAAGQATGLVLAKAGMGATIEPLPATFIRMIAATGAIWLIGLIRRDNLTTIQKLRDRTALLLAIGGSICGPFLGVWMSLVAVRHTSAGIAATIMATVPVLVIPLVIIIYKESVSLRAVLGAIITAGGVAILFLS
jgi:drug/metabolite transporter (DMT)-like permease